MPISVHERSTEIALIERARAGDPDALGTLYQRHAEPLFRLAFRLLGSAAEAEDLVQDLFVGLPEALRRYEERGALEAWLRRVVVRMALMRFRRDRRRGEVALPDPELPGAPSVGASAERLSLRLALAEAIRGLSDSLRTVFVLREVEGYSHAEIAEMLGIRVGTSEVRLHRAIRLLRQTLRNDR